MGWNRATNVQHILNCHDMLGIQTSFNCKFQLTARKTDLNANTYLDIQNKEVVKINKHNHSLSHYQLNKAFVESKIILLITRG